MVQLAFKAERGSIFHYPLQGLSLIHKLLGQEVIISYNANNFFSDYTGGIRRKFLFTWRALNASKIDVLNPDNLKKFIRKKITKHKVILNPGSVVNLKHYLSHDDKYNWIVFCGRFADRDPNNVLKFVEAIPAIAQLLKQEKFEGVKFFILGYGPLEEQLKNKLAEDSFKGIDCDLRFENLPSKVLKHSKVFVAVQKSSNYPSKSLLEALACGNLPVVTDVGETRLIAEESFAKFVPENFTYAELAQAILEIMLMQREDFLQRTQIARQFLMERFDIHIQEEYYLKLYGINHSSNC